MPWSSDFVPLAEVQLRDLDRPLLCSQANKNLVRGKWTLTRDLTAADRTLAGNPVNRTVDRFTHRVTRPDAADFWNVLFEFPAPGISFDFIMLINHTAETGEMIELFIADDETFTTRFQSLGSPTIVKTGQRHVDLTLSDGVDSNARFNDVLFAGMGFSASRQQELGEVIFGRSFPLRFGADRPHNTEALAAAGAIRQFRSGSVDRFRAHDGARVLADKVQVAGSYTAQPAATRQFSQDVLDWWAATDEGRRPFIWIENPSKVGVADSSFRAYYMEEAAGDPSLRFAEVAAGRRTLSLDAVEQGPDFQGGEL